MALSKVIYLNRSGVSVTPGSSDSRINRTSVTDQPATIPAWHVTDEVWADTVTCLQTMFLPFDVELTEIDPGMTPHIEAVFGGSPSLFGLGSRTAGVAPLSTTCAVVENAMVFTFTDILVNKAQVVCETMSQEIAHAYGLDHEMLESDPMSYLKHNGNRTFQDVTASCGETSARPCGIGATSCRAEQNSYAILLERLGATGEEPEPIVPPKADDPSADPTEVGCNSGGQRSGGLTALALVGVMLRRRRIATSRSAR